MIDRGMSVEEFVKEEQANAVHGVVPVTVPTVPDFTALNAVITVLAVDLAAGYDGITLTQRETRALLDGIAKLKALAGVVDP